MEIIIFIAVLALLAIILYFSSEIDISRVIRLSRLAKKYKLKYSPNIYVAVSAPMPEKWKTNLLEGVLQGKHVRIYDEHTTKDSRDMGINSIELAEASSGPIGITHTVITVDDHEVSERRGELSVSKIERAIDQIIHGDVKK